MDEAEPTAGAPEPMRYAMLGDDGASTFEKLAKYTGVVSWGDLQPHFESDALLYVDPSQSITEVGTALSEDDRPRIEALLGSGDLVRPGPPHAQYWAASKQSFTALVVSPFVLIQPVEDDV